MTGKSVRVNILVEGQTEETFIRDLVAPHLAQFNVWVNQRIIETSKGHKGGAVSYEKIKNQLIRWCKSDSTAFVTTLIDLYGLPSEFPGVSNWNCSLDPGPQVAQLENKLSQDVGQQNFISYLQLHEFEALLFSNLDAFSIASLDPKIIEQLKSQLKQFDGPERVNNSRSTAPSKRIISVWPKYEKTKTLNGPLIAKRIGLSQIRSQCPRFSNWLTQLENLSCTD